jgi:hypothetical protein
VLEDYWNLSVAARHLTIMVHLRKRQLKLLTENKSPRWETENKQLRGARRLLKSELSPRWETGINLRGERPEIRSPRGLEHRPVSSQPPGLRHPSYARFSCKYYLHKSNVKTGSQHGGMHAWSYIYTKINKWPVWKWIMAFNDQQWPNMMNKSSGNQVYVIQIILTEYDK